MHYTHQIVFIEYEKRKTYNTVRKTKIVVYLSIASLHIFNRSVCVRNVDNTMKLIIFNFYTSRRDKKAPLVKKSTIRVFHNA